jgi:hypothetical protein
MQSDLHDQDEKKIRAIKAVRKIIKDIKSERRTLEIPDEEYDLKLRLLKDKTNIALSEIIRLGSEHPEIQSAINELFEKVRI